MSESIEMATGLEIYIEASSKVHLCKEIFDDSKLLLLLY